MKIYKADEKGNAPGGLSKGDQVVTAGGTYTISDAGDAGASYNPASGYYSRLTDRSQTTATYRGSYANAAGAESSGGSGAFAYDPQRDEAYQNALSRLQSAVRQEPAAYASAYESQLEELYQQLMNRPAFSYELQADPLYRQARDSYVQQGRLAMMDSMGQAAALTGGYASSYAQSVGQQSYNDYLQRLGEQVPALYAQAYERYTQQGKELLSRYNTAAELEKRDYQRYQNGLNQYRQELEDLTKQAQTAYEQGYDNWYKALSAQNSAYGRALQAASRSGDYSALSSFGWTESQSAAASAKSASGGGGAKKESAQSGSTIPRFYQQDEAVRYLRGQGVPAAVAASLYDERNWRQFRQNSEGRDRSSYASAYLEGTAGQGVNWNGFDAEGKRYDSYLSYLNETARRLLQKYGQ